MSSRPCSTTGASFESTSGTVTGTVVAADIVGPAGQGIQPGDFASVVAAMRAGATYANIHTQARPTGELRADIGQEE